MDNNDEEDIEQQYNFSVVIKKRYCTNCHDICVFGSLNSVNMHTIHDTPYALPDSNISLNTECHIHQFLYYLFDRHHNFYQRIPEINHLSESMLDNRFHCYESTFNHGNNGFRRFMEEVFSIQRWKDIDEEGIQYLNNIITKYVKEKLLEYQNMQNVNIECVSMVSVDVANDTEEGYNLETLLPKIISEDAIIVSGNSTYRVDITPIKSHGLHDYQKNIRDRLLEVFKKQLHRQAKLHQERIRILEERMERQRRRGFMDGLTHADIIKEHGWVVKNDGEIWYEKFIPIKRIRHNNQYHTIEEIEPYLKDVIPNYEDFKLGVEAVTVYLDSDCQIRSAFIPKGMVGNHANANPPTEDDSGDLCLGTIAGKDLEYVLRNLPNMMELANLDSAYETQTTTYLERAVHQFCKDNDIPIPHDDDYHPDDEYVCEDCGISIGIDEYFICHECGVILCDSCAFFDDRCGYYYCANHSTPCDHCSTYHCDQCMEECKKEREASETSGSEGDNTQRHGHVPAVWNVSGGTQ